MSQRLDYYNNAVASLQAQLNNTIRKINAMRISSLLKKRLITAAINAANANLEILKKQFKTKKSALLIGINYTNTPYELYGCINDTKNIQNLLQTKYGYTDIKMLNDETTEKPTRQNILNGLQTLLKNPVTPYFSCIAAMEHVHTIIAATKPTAKTSLLCL
jgi:hypothetical protein